MVAFDKFFISVKKSQWEVYLSYRQWQLFKLKILGDGFVVPANHRPMKLRLARRAFTSLD